MFRLLILVFLCGCGTAQAHDRLSVIIPFSAGGATDQIWRVLHLKLNQELSKSRISLDTEYLPGAGGGIGTVTMTQRNTATLLFTSASIAIIPLVNPDIRYDLKSLQLVGHAGYYPLVIFTRYGRFQSWRDLRNRCIHNTVLYGNSGLGSMTHMATEFAFRQWNCRTSSIPYKSASLSFPDLILGDLDFVTDHPSNSVIGLVEQRKIQPLLVLSDDTVFMLPNTPLAKEVGIKSDLGNWHVLVSNSVINGQTLHQIKDAFNTVMSRPQTQHELNQLGLSFSKQPAPLDFLFTQQSRFRSLYREQF